MWKQSHFFDALHPVLNILERLLVCDVIHQDDALTCREKGARERERKKFRSQSKIWSEHKEPVMFVLHASCAHHGSSVVGCCNGLEPLLPCCVPARAQSSSKKKSALMCWFSHQDFQIQHWWKVSWIWRCTTTHLLCNFHSESLPYVTWSCTLWSMCDGDLDNKPCHKALIWWTRGRFLFALREIKTAAPRRKRRNITQPSMCFAKNKQGISRQEPNSYLLPDL